MHDLKLQHTQHSIASEGIKGGPVTMQLSGSGGLEELQRVGVVQKLRSYKRFEELQKAERATESWSSAEAWKTTKGWKSCRKYT